MQNRSLELCMVNHINTINEFANKVGIDLDQAVALINKDDSVIIKEETISKCLSYFNCSYNYFVCLVD
jgi:hypothetical protein